MGDRLTEDRDTSPAQTSPTPFGDTFDEALPQYLAMGMPYDLYWDGEFGTKRAFRKAYEIRLEREQRIADQNNWYMGQYIISALKTTPLLVAGLNVRQGAQLPGYAEKPFFEMADKQKKEDVRKKKEENQQKLAMAMFQAMSAEFNKNFKKKEHVKATDAGR